MPARIPFVRDEPEVINTQSWDDILRRLNANPWSHEVNEKPPKLEKWAISCGLDGAPKLVLGSYGSDTKQKAIDAYRKDAKANIVEDYQEINGILSGIARSRDMLAKLDKLEKEL
jgi:hypothetical protein